MDHLSPNCLQKYRESRLQYVYIIKFSHKVTHWNAACYFGMLCSFFQQSDFTLSLKRTRGIFTGKCIHTKQHIHHNSVTFSDDFWVRSRNKKLHFSGSNNSKSFTTFAPQSHWGRTFSILEKNRAQKH